MEAIVKSNQEILLGAMPLVNTYEARLRLLNAWWDKVSLIGKINSQNVASSILDDMQITKRKFTELQAKLIQNLLLENLQKCVHSDASKSQVIIDILIRNLFERTADVGFLATDDDIRHFLNRTDTTEADKHELEARLHEYVKKYSVYDEIIILDTQGNVRAHLNQNNHITKSNDALIQQTLNTDEEYIETFRYSDLQANNTHSLIYSCKITATNDHSSQVLGVLCLCFRFDNEMASIFQNLLLEGDRSTLMVLDSSCRVIASSNPAYIPLQTSFKQHHAAKITSYSGEKVLSSMTETNGYQGFSGLGWHGQVITSIASAFKQNTTSGAISAYQNEMHQAQMFSAELKEIHRISIDVNDDLSLVVLNGKITAARKKAIEFMPVLEEIKKIGEDTAGIFTDSINNLLTTVVSSRLNDVSFIAALAVDIMDRNLYERANDCRWWALTSAFRQILDTHTIDTQDVQKLNDTLIYINDLYTVYTNLYVYDKQGKILAVSNPDEKDLIGSQLTEDDASAQALTLSDSQQYAVSDFIKTNLYNNRHTYIYNAAITRSQGLNPVIGGIGVVFDSEPEFKAMLDDVLPRDEHEQLIEGAFGVFCNRDKIIIATSSATDLNVGEALNIGKHFFEIENGVKKSEITNYNGSRYALGTAASQGYREYKTTGDYDNDIIAFVFMPF